MYFLELLGWLTIATPLATVGNTEVPRPDDLLNSARDDVINPPIYAPNQGGTCTPKLLGTDLEAPAHDLLQTADPQTSEECSQACCQNLKCAGALFEPISAITYGGCAAGKPCCFMKTSVAVHQPMKRPVKGGSFLWMIPERPQDDEKLNFLSATLGDHMVLQRAPQQAVVWGHTSPGANVTTTMAPSNAAACQIGGGHASVIKPSCVLQSFVTVAGDDGTWRQRLPAIPASKTAYEFTFSSSSALGEKASMKDVLFGDVFLCGGQSNMEFSMMANANASAEKQMANAFPTIRLFSVGHRTSSPTPLRDLQTVWEPWQVASNLTINKDGSPGHTLFSTFSAVCWFFGRELSSKLSPTGDVPIGLISNNWGGTKVEVWSPAKSLGQCNRTGVDGPMFNAMILPYASGPMSISGFTWYQGEANTATAASAEEYSCLFPQMITAWREAFNKPDAYFGFIQLSTWCALPPASLPQMREAQMAALALPNVGYATNADRGMGCSIHPAAKQDCGKRLAASALALHYKQDTLWRSPTYRGAAQVQTTSDKTHALASLAVSLNDVSNSGLQTVYPFNYDSPGYGSSARTVVDCFAPYPVNATYNSSMTEQCAWAGLHISGIGWLNASVTIQSGGQSLLLTSQLPSSIEGSPVKDSPAIIGSAYGWGPIPMMSAYDKGTGLPVLAWNRTVDRFGTTLI